jgi:hypothetical protein
MKLSALFTPNYGSKLDFNKLKVCKKQEKNAVNFVSRSSQNLGIVATIKKIPNKEPFPVGSITVTLGGTYVLASFVQPMPFYTAQNVMVLIPKKEMSFEEKIFYCLCISKNRFRYSAFGREANRTLKDLEIPDKIPDFVNKKNIQLVTSKTKEIISNILS